MPTWKKLYNLPFHYFTIASEVVNMKTKTYFFRLIIALIALVIGLGVYRIVERFQQSFDEHDACLNQPQNVIQVAPKEQPVETAPIQEDLQDSEFYPDGEYYPSEEDLVDGFRNLEELTIEANDWTEATDDIPPKQISPKGMLKAGNEFNFTKISINNRLISFETEKINGIKFTFVGNFLDPSDFEGNPPLSGILTKYKDGKIVAKREFGFYADGC
jgi:hypothetical protein